MSTQTRSKAPDARKAIKEALARAKAGKEQTGVSPSTLELTTEQVREIARSLLDEWNVLDRWKIESSDRGLLFFVPLPEAGLRPR